MLTLPESLHSGIRLPKKPLHLPLITIDITQKTHKSTKLVNFFSAGNFALSGLSRNDSTRNDNGSNESENVVRFEYGIDLTRAANESNVERSTQTHHKKTIQYNEYNNDESYNDARPVNDSKCGNGPASNQLAAPPMLSTDKCENCANVVGS
jgi:hypothetical protein